MAPHRVESSAIATTILMANRHARRAGSTGGCRFAGTPERTRHTRLSPIGAARQELTQPSHDHRTAGFEPAVSIGAWIGTWTGLGMYRYQWPPRSNAWNSPCVNSTYPRAVAS